MSRRNCEHCLQYWYDEETGKPELGRDNLPILRHAGCPAPCRTEIGCPKGTPENSKALSPRNRQVIEFHRECEAVGNFPNDPIVRQNAALIALVDRADEVRHRAEISALVKGLARG
ncbi:MAG: hypothetical protein ACF8CY_05330 [Gimesia chilikensis]